MRNTRIDMDCNTAQKKILLAQSGELGRRDEQRLLEHLSACRDCRLYMGDADKIVGLARDSLRERGPSSSVLAGITAAAEQRVRKGKIIAFPWAAVRLAACAAVLVFVIGGGLMVSRWGSGDEMLDEELEEMLAKAVSEEVGLPDAEVDEDAASLAEQLVLLEELDIEEFLEDEKLIQQLESESTDLQSRSTDEPPAKEYV